MISDRSRFKMDLVDTARADAPLEERNTSLHFSNKDIKSDGLIFCRFPICQSQVMETVKYTCPLIAE